MPMVGILRYCIKVIWPISKILKTKTSLNNEPNVKQAIGAYQCQQSNSWIVSIEPTADVRSTQYPDARAIRLNVQLMSASEARQFYKNTGLSTANTKKTPVATPKAIATKASLERNEGS